jgi:CTP:molybdopterin cytidylyltransferase MocA
MTVTILIPAAGFGRRMLGADKLLEPVDGLPLLARTARRACAASPSVLVALPSTDHPRAASLDGMAVRLVEVPDNDTGMAASLRRGAAEVPNEHAVMILPGDMPELTTDDLTAMIKAHEGSPDQILQATSASGTPGHPVIFPAELVPAFARLSGDEGARSILKANRDRLRQVALPDNHAVTDLDTPEAWANWRAAHPALRDGT